MLWVPWVCSVAVGPCGEKAWCCGAGCGAPLLADACAAHRFHMDPSGTFVQCDARAIGSASEGAQSSLQEVYHKVKAVLG